MSEQVATLPTPSTEGPTTIPCVPSPPAVREPSVVAPAKAAPEQAAVKPQPASPPVSTNQGKQSPPTAANSTAKKTPFASALSVSEGSVPTRTSSASSLSGTSQLPPNVPVYTKPAILALPPTAVLTKQEMDFRANLLNPNNDMFWTARGLIRPSVLADALAQGHAILKYEGHLTQKQGGRRLSAQYGRSGGSGPSTAPSAPPANLVLGGFGTGMNALVGGSVAAVPGSWRSAAPALPTYTSPAFVTKEDMDTRANQLNPNNDVFWTSRGLSRPPVLADALAQGHAILQLEGHVTQTQTHKTRGRLNSLPTNSLYSNTQSDYIRPISEARRSISGQGLPSTARIGGNRPSSNGNQPAMRRRASTTGSIATPALDGSVTKGEVDLRANMMNPNNSVFWTSRGLVRPTDLQEALAKGHAVLEAEGHTTHAQGCRAKSWNRRGSRTELHSAPAVQPLVAAAQRQWSTPFLGPNSGVTPAMPRSGALPGAAWVGGGAPVPARHPDWQSNAQQRRRYSLPPPGFELFTPPSHFGLYRPPMLQRQQQAQPIVREGAADGEWEKMDEKTEFARPLPSHNAAIPILKPPQPATANSETAKKSEGASSWVRKEPAKTSIFLENEKDSSEGGSKDTAQVETEKMKSEDKEANVKIEATSATAAPSEPTTPASDSGKSGDCLDPDKLKSGGEARESESSSKSATV